jgi:hypothetical protein
MWAFVENVPAQQSSRRRPTGTLETKEVFVTMATYRDMVTTWVVPASDAVAIQQDHAPAHVKPDDPQFKDVAACYGRHLKLRYHPANSRI